MVFSFEVEGRPQALPRPKFVRIGSNVHTYTPKVKCVEDYKDKVREGFTDCLEKTNLFEGVLPYHGLVKVYVDFYIKRPVRLLAKKNGDDPFPHICKPDLDNLLKTVLDALTGYAWRDDSQVWFGTCRKFYTGVSRLTGRRKPELAKTVVSVEFIDVVDLN